MSFSGRDHAVRAAVNLPVDIQEALRNLGVSNSVTGCDNLSGGCIHNVRRIRFDDRSDLVAKSSDLGEGARQLRSEQEGLLALIQVAKPITYPDPQLSKSILACCEACKTSQKGVGKRF